VRTFRISVMGGFITRLGVGGLPFLLPLLYQLGLKLPAWQSGLLMMPTAAAAMGMKLIAPKVLARFGYRQVLVVNTICIGLTIGMFSLVGVNTPWFAIAGIALLQGFFNSLQFSSMNTLAYADVEPKDSSMASTIASSFQQLSMSFRPGLGVAGDGLVPGPRAADQPGDGECRDSADSRSGNAPACRRGRRRWDRPDTSHARCRRRTAPRPAPPSGWRHARRTAG
jgi:hypothetical protein